VRGRHLVESEGAHEQAVIEGNLDDVVFGDAHTDHDPCHQSSSYSFRDKDFR